MTTTQRPRPSSQPTPPPNTASRGLILVAVAVILGVILLFKGGGAGFEQDSPAVKIGSAGEESTEPVDSTTTTEAAPTTSVAPSALTVVALNGAGISGLAGQTVTFLNVAGYTAASAGDAAMPVTTTTAYYSPGFEADGAAVAALFNLPPEQIQPLAPGTVLSKDPATQPPDTNVVVVLGPEVEPIVTAGAADGAADGAEDGAQPAN